MGTRWKTLTSNRKAVPSGRVEKKEGNEGALTLCASAFMWEMTMWGSGTFERKKLAKPFPSPDRKKRGPGGGCRPAEKQRDHA